jgi:hypothetical protein
MKATENWSNSRQETLKRKSNLFVWLWRHLSLSLDALLNLSNLLHVLGIYNHHLGEEKGGGSERGTGEQVQ